MSLSVNNLFIIHAIIMSIAIFITFPFALVMSIGKVVDNWYTYHKYAMFLTTFLIFCGVLLSLFAKDLQSEKNLSGMSALHGTLGIILLILFIIQLWWAIVMRRYLHQLNKRKTWLVGHILIAILIVILIILQVYFGSKMLQK